MKNKDVGIYHFLKVTFKYLNDPLIDILYKEALTYVPSVQKIFQF